jgi:hypothetical protein
MCLECCCPRQRRVLHVCVSAFVTLLICVPSGNLRRRTGWCLTCMRRTCDEMHCCGRPASVHQMQFSRAVDYPYAATGCIAACAVDMCLIEEDDALPACCKSLSRPDGWAKGKTHTLVKCSSATKVY